MNEYMEISFKDFLIRETQEFLGKEIGRILSSLQSLSDDAKKIGAEKLVEYVKTLISDIQSIVGGHWLPEDIKYLLDLQKVGVALSKSLDEKNDLHGTLQSSAEQLKATLKNMGVPVNDLGITGKDQPAKPKQFDNTSSTLKTPTQPTIAPELPQGAPNPPENPAAPLGEPPLN